MLAAVARSREETANQTMNQTATETPNDGPAAPAKGWGRAVGVEVMRGLVLAGVVGAIIAAVLPARAPSAITPPPLPEGWTLTSWPYLRDQFDTGVAVQCTGATCAAPMQITVRPKRGFCDCERGVYDDTQLRDVGDLALSNTVFKPSAPGEAVRIAGLNGRLQPHAAQNGDTAISAALHSNCDVISIVARGPAGPRVTEELVGFLQAEPVATWLTNLLKEPKSR